MATSGSVARVRHVEEEICSAGLVHLDVMQIRKDQRWKWNPHFQSINPRCNIFMTMQTSSHSFSFAVLNMQRLDWLSSEGGQYGIQEVMHRNVLDLFGMKKKQRKRWSLHGGANKEKSAAYRGWKTRKWSAVQTKDGALSTNDGDEEMKSKPL